MTQDGKVGLAAVALAALALGAVADAPAQGHGTGGGHDHAPAAPSAPGPPGPATRGTAEPESLRATMEELHRHGGTPRGWKFTLPAGDPARGRQVFADLECYKCHTVKGGGFPATGEAEGVGPDLTGMGGEHPAEYLAESVLAPNRVIVEGPGFTGADGRSKMPSFADSLSVAQWVDLVAYLKSLTGGGGAPHHDDGEIERERVEGDYRIRVVYAPARTPGGAHAGHGSSSPHQPAPPREGTAGAPHAHGKAHQDAHHAPGATTAAHLMAFVLDRDTGEPVPYLPVTVTVHVAGAPARSVRLAPMIDDRGFHYGADLALPAGTERLVVGIGVTTMRVMDGARGRFTRPVSAVFDWPSR